MYPHQIERLTGALEGAGLDAIIATTPANIAYLTGFHGLTHAIFRTPQFAVFHRGGTALVVPASEPPAIVADALDVDHVVCFGGFVSEFAEPVTSDTRRIREIMAARAPTPVEALALALDALGARRGSVGLDGGGLTHESWERLTARLADFKVVPAGDALLAARRVKSPYEIECLARALAIAEEAANAVIQVLKPGVTEREAVALYQAEVVKRDAAPYPAIIATGERSSVPAPHPTDRALRPRELVRFDLGCVYKGYCSSLARMAVMGEPDSRQEAAHAALVAGLEAATGAVRSGLSAGRVFESAVEATRAAGLSGYTRFHVGHGIGLEPCERPKLSSGEQTLFEAGEVIRVELPHYEHGWAGLNVKDTLLVTRTGAQGLNRSSRGLVVLD